MTGRTQSATFGPGFFRFLRELKRNNNRPWFLENKERFERDVLGASLAFVATVGPEIHRVNPNLVADARPSGGSLMRIYRDVRFSKDKSPYRTSMGIHFFHRASEGHEGGLPGFFLHLSPGGSFVASGMWMPSPADLEKIRRTLVRDPKGWAKARSIGLDVDEDALKRVPPGFDASLPVAADIRRKSFVASRSVSDREVTARDFSERFVAECRRQDPLNRYLAAATGVAY